MIINVMIECEEAILEEIIERLQKRGIAHNNSNAFLSQRGHSVIILGYMLDEDTISALKSTSGVRRVWREI